MIGSSVNALLLGLLLPSACAIYGKHHMHMESPLAVVARYRPSDVLSQFIDGTDLAYNDIALRRSVNKRNAANMPALPDAVPVCTSQIVPDHRPKKGITPDGGFVEVQQDETRQFSANFVECAKPFNPPCEGIDARFSSECATTYAVMQASVRAEGSDDPFKEGLIKVPVACECKVRRKYLFRS